MPSKKGTEQAILWLSSMARTPGLDGINAELCLNIIRDLQEQNGRKGALIHKLKRLTEDNQYSIREPDQMIFDDFDDF